MNLSKVTIKGQVTLPAELRKRFGIEHGNTVTFVAGRGGILVKPIAVQDLTKTPQWKRDLDRALKDSEEGRVETYMSDEEFLASFDQPKRSKNKSRKRKKA